jgi:hypothetical protein
MNPFQDPLHWTRRNQLVWLGISVFGAALGVMLEFIHSPFFSLTRSRGAFIAWLSVPQSYWSWAIFGFLITAAIFYAAQLFRTSN